MERLKDDRSYYLVVVLCFIPFGWIYGLWFQYDAIKALNLACGRKEGSDTSRQSPGFLAYFLFTWITLGIYGLYWLYKQGHRMSDAGEKYGITDEFIDPERKGFTWVIVGIVMSVLSILLFVIPVIGWILGLLVSVAGFIVTIININKFYKDLNVLSRAYNIEIANGDGSSPSKPALVDRSDRRPLPNDQLDELKPVPSIGGNGGQKPRPQISPSGGVIMLSCQYAGSKIDMKPGETITIGRDPSRCALICESERVSRVHVSIRAQSGSYYVTDMSTNGTISSESGRLPKNQQVLQHAGTVLKLGQSDESIRLI